MDIRNELAELIASRYRYEAPGSPVDMIGDATLWDGALWYGFGIVAARVVGVTVSDFGLTFREFADVPAAAAWMDGIRDGSVDPYA